MLTVEQTDFYEQNGYLMVEDVITLSLIHI